MRVKQVPLPNAGLRTATVSHSPQDRSPLSARFPDSECSVATTSGVRSLRSTPLSNDPCRMAYFFASRFAAFSALSHSARSNGSFEDTAPAHHSVRVAFCDPTMVDSRTSMGTSLPVHFE
jgi:hypothetical protein